MAQEIDWNAVLADLEARRATLDTAITSLRGLITGGGLEAILATPVTVKQVDAREMTDAPQEVRPGVFHGMSVSEACRTYLEITKKKQKTRAICDAVLQGGIESDARDFYSNVYTTMARNKDFIKLGKYWALSEWYPARAAAAVAAKPGKKTRRRANKPRTTRKQRPEGSTASKSPSPSEAA
jgi:hypothetical protein